MVYLRSLKKGSPEGPFFGGLLLIWDVVSAAQPGVPAIASAHPPAIRAGHQVLKQGSNAFMQRLRSPIVRGWGWWRILVAGSIRY